MAASGRPAPRLRVLPGLGLDHRSWSPTLSALGVDHSVVLATGAFGRAREPAEDLRPAALAGRIARDLASGPAVVLAGHSASCQVVAHVARLVPDWVRGLILVGPTADPCASAWPRLIWRWMTTAVHEDPRQVPLLIRQYAPIGLGTMARAMNLARFDRLDHTLAAVSCPVLVVRGRDDAICPPDWAATLSSDAVTLAAGAHMVPWTHGTEVAAQIDRFLRHEPAPGHGNTG